MKKNIVLTITGPSLSGKSTLANILINKHPEYKTVVTHTTREMRDGETNGQSYHFVNKDEFKKMIDNNSMVEFAEVGPKGNTQFYGTSLKALEDVFNEGKIPVLVIEPNGAKNVNSFCKKNNILTFQIFISNPPNVLFKRFLQRFKDDSKATVENYAKRMENMVHVEPLEWIKPALNGEGPYDIAFVSFDGEESTNKVLTKTIEGVNNKLLNKNKTKKHDLKEILHVNVSSIIKKKP